MKLILLTVCVLLVCVHGKAVAPSNVLSEAEVQTLFIELTKPYDDTKDYLNGIADKRVDEIIEQIKAIPAELQALLRIKESIQSHVPAHHNASLKALDELSSHLLTASNSLSHVLRDCNPASPAVSSASSDSEEQGKPAETHDGSGYATLLNEKKQPRTQAASSEVDVDKLVPLLSRPVEINKTAVSAVLARYGENNYIKQEDAASAVLKLAVIIAEKHRVRYLTLLPKMTSVGAILNDILSKLDALQVDVLGILSDSENLKNQVHRNLRTIHGLAQNISNTVQGLKCT